jgi:uncharacterized protein YcfL
MKSSLVLLVALFCVACTAHEEEPATEAPQRLTLVFNETANEYQDTNGKSYSLPVIMDKALAGSTIELCDKMFASCQTLRAYN